MTPRARGRLAALAALAVAVAVVAFLVLQGGGPKPEAAVDRYLAAWSRGDDAGAGARHHAPAPARAALEASRAGLDGARVTARRTSVKERATTRRPRACG